MQARGLGVLLVVLVAACSAAGAAGRPDASCTAAYKSAAAAAAATYAKEIPKARAAYFKTHKSAKLRAAFVKKQAAKLASLRRNAACSVVESGGGAEPLPAPAPTANEHFTFSDELSQGARDDLQGDVTFAVQDEQKLLGVTLGELDVYASTDAAWLAKEQCTVLPQDGDCISTMQAAFAGGQPTQDGPHVLFVNLATTDLTSRAPTYEPQKIVATAVANVFRYQLDGRRDDVGPVWLLFGTSELTGYHVSADRNLRSYADDLADMRQNIKALPTPLEQILTWSDYNLVGHWFLAGAVDRLVTVAPNGISSIAAYYAGIGKGETWQDAFASAFGMTVDAFYADFAAYRAKL